MLTDLLKKENVKIKEGVQNWQEAVRVSLQDLVKGGYVEERYIDNVISSTHQYGPYYILAEDIALIHGRPEAGVLRRQMAVTLLRKPVRFPGDSYPVRLMIALAATDSASHLDAMKVLATILMDETKIQEMTEADTPETLYQLFLKAEEETEE